MQPVSFLDLELGEYLPAEPHSSSRSGRHRQTAECRFEAVYPDQRCSPVVPGGDKKPGAGI